METGQEGDSEDKSDAVQHVTDKTAPLTALDSATDAQRQARESDDVDMNAETPHDRQSMPPEDTSELPVVEVAFLYLPGLFNQVC